jgi:hypothetical protein
VKKLKDYLQHYVGCDCMTRHGVMKLVEFNNRNTRVMLWNYEYADYNGPFSYEEISPILRPLSDACMQEKADAKNLIVLDKWGQQTIESMAAVTNFLRSKEFDCDGLIDAKLAIAKSNNTPKTINYGTGN